LLNTGFRTYFVLARRTTTGPWVQGLKKKDSRSKGSKEEMEGKKGLKGEA